MVLTISGSRPASGGIETEASYWSLSSVYLQGKECFSAVYLPAVDRDNMAFVLQVTRNKNLSTSGEILYLISRL